MYLLIICPQMNTDKMLLLFNVGSNSFEQNGSAHADGFLCE